MFINLIATISKVSKGGVRDAKKNLRAKYTDAEIDTLFKDLGSNHQGRPIKGNSGVQHEFKQKHLNGKSGGEMMAPYLFLQIKMSDAMIAEIKKNFILHLKRKGCAPIMKLQLIYFRVIVYLLFVKNTGLKNYRGRVPS